MTIADVEAAVATLKGRSKIVVFSGSGLSAASGIPTFSDEHDPLTDFGIERWEQDAEWRPEVWRLLFEEFWAGVQDRDRHTLGSIQPEKAPAAGLGWGWCGEGVTQGSEAHGHHAAGRSGFAC